jgi:anthranilate/para-aminobenzoate synthase component II
VYNDEYGRDWERVKAEAGAFDNIVISPGPGTPDVADDFGISAAALREADIPVLGEGEQNLGQKKYPTWILTRIFVSGMSVGICLGHQGLGSAHGGHVVRAPVPMHGRLARIRHTAKGIFHGLPADFLVRMPITAPHVRVLYRVPRKPVTTQAGLCS